MSSLHMSGFDGISIWAVLEFVELGRGIQLKFTVIWAQTQLRMLSVSTAMARLAPRFYGEATPLGRHAIFTPSRRLHGRLWAHFSSHHYDHGLSLHVGMW
jgi:hypothetical protein